MKKFLSIFLGFILTLATFSLNGLTETKASNVSSTTALQQFVGNYNGYYNNQNTRYGINLKVYKASDGKYYATLNSYYLSNNAAIATYNLNVSYNISTRKYELAGYKKSGNSNSNYISITGTLVGNNFSGTMVSNATKNSMTVSLNKVTSSQNANNKLTSQGKYMLWSVPAYQSHDYAEYISSKGSANSFSMAGKKYYDGCIWTLNHSENTYSIYALDKKYTNISGILGHVDGSSTLAAGTLQIFLDGNLYKELSLTPDIIPYELNINVTNITQLKIVVNHNWALSGSSYGLGDLKIR